jgi:hypothetical protein
MFDKQVRYVTGYSNCCWFICTSGSKGQTEVGHGLLPDHLHYVVVPTGVQCVAALPNSNTGVAAVHHTVAMTG